MKRIAYFISLALLLAGFQSCKVDTYDLPEETIQGRLADADGNGLICEQPNGFKIRMHEEGSSTPYDFWGKPDGTFRNTKIFKGKYKIEPIDGAFFAVDPVEKDINGSVTINFEIIPYLTINANIAQNGANLKATYTIKKAAGAGKIKNSYLLLTKWNPNVGMNYSDKNSKRDLSTVADSEIQTKTYEDNIVDCLESGVTYYARVAVLAENSLGRYNLSPVHKIVVP